VSNGAGGARWHCSPSAKPSLQLVHTHMFCCLYCLCTAGIGLLTYRQLLADLATAFPHRPILALEYKHVSMRLTTYVPRWACWF
jgi:hypothetical protein